MGEEWRPAESRWRADYLAETWTVGNDNISTAHSCWPRLLSVLRDEYIWHSGFKSNSCAVGRYAARLSQIGHRDGVAFQYSIISDAKSCAKLRSTKASRSPFLARNLTAIPYLPYSGSTETRRKRLLLRRFDANISPVRPHSGHIRANRSIYILCVVVDGDGNLQFSHVTQHDGRDNLVYQCAATSPVLQGEYRAGDEIQLVVVPSVTGEDSVHLRNNAMHSFLFSQID